MSSMQFMRTSAVVVLFAGLIAGCGERNTLRTFDTPEDAMRALVTAVENGSSADVEAIVGRDLIESLMDDEDLDAEVVRKLFVRAARTQIQIQPDPENPAQQIAALGQLEWPFPAPLVRDGSKWRFDGEAGADEVTYRRIGRNELKTLAFAFGYVDAQEEYASADRDGDGTLEYAVRINSTPGLKDGLYWSTATGEDMSPVGPFAAAAAFGEEPPGGRPEPLAGYWVKLIPAADATRMPTAIAWPAEYAFTGIVTFAVDEKGDIYQKDLGEDTVKLAKELAAFTPDDSWERATEPEPAD
jgi:hypothetical protein